ncbi:MAG: hypothetical protein IT342_22210 [Candidatus Melainabacteria bacterium]|nr:hypothetical protein [Candidatus Melainabacteria bacterium]
MPTGGESTVALEHLDSHIRAIIKLKLRAFVHLNPCFDSIHSIDMDKSQTHTINSLANSSQPVFYRAAQKSSLPQFPPIPEQEAGQNFAENQGIQKFSPNLPVSHQQNAQSGDCPNRLSSARLRRRARV